MPGGKTEHLNNALLTLPFVGDLINAHASKTADENNEKIQRIEDAGMQRYDVNQGGSGEKQSYDDPQYQEQKLNESTKKENDKNIFQKS